MVNKNDDIGVAIVGMAVRLPGGIKDTNGYWTNLRDGVCSIREFSKSELEESGVPAHLLAQTC